ncbi:MAG TPA: transposase [Aridibacter sp.]|nr:transposase [Aridibacter sp.]
MERRSKFDFEGWHYRGYLPHFEAGSTAQFITFRLADSLPISLFRRLKIRLETGQISKSEYGYFLDRYLDRSKGDCFLNDRRISILVRDSILFGEGSRYKLHSWVIMPNHVHLLITPDEDQTLERIMHSIKSFTAHGANKILKRKGSFWSKEYFDRFIRDGKHFAKTMRYIAMNPVKAGLCDAPEKWEFSGAFKGKDSEA